MNLMHKSVQLPLLLVISLFFLWGMANSLNDILATHFKKLFTLTDFRAGLVQAAFYTGYFIFSIPAALWMKRFGYKAAVVFGLMLYGIGAFMFYPAAGSREYSLFLLALFVIASGLAFLETSANPLIVAMGDQSTAERRLNFAQSFNPFGCITGIYIGREFIFSGHEPSLFELGAMNGVQLEQFYRTETQAVQGPYLVLGVVVVFWALLILLVKFPPIATQRHLVDAGGWADYKALLRNRLFMFGVAAQFFYVGAQVGIWSFLIRYGQKALPGMGEKALANYLVISLLLFMIGRFVAAALMSRWRAAWLMKWYALINVLLCIYAILFPSYFGLLALVAASFFMSLMFPTIFALSIKNLEGLAKAGSSLVVMALIGGAVLTAVMGLMSDIWSIHVAVMVPCVCFAVIATYAHTRDRVAAVLEVAP